VWKHFHGNHIRHQSLASHYKTDGTARHGAVRHGAAVPIVKYAARLDESTKQGVKAKRERVPAWTLPLHSYLGFIENVVRVAALLGKVFDSL